MLLAGGERRRPARRPLNAKHFFWAPGQSPRAPSPTRPRTTSSTTAATPAPARSASRRSRPSTSIYWGPEWAAGFQTADTDGKLYLEQDAAELPQLVLRRASAAARGQASRRSTAAASLPGSTSCVGGTGFVTNPKHQLKGVWTDPTPVPADIVTLGLAENLVDDPIATEASAPRRTSATTRSDVHHPDAAAHDRDRRSPSTAATTRRRRASTASGTRTGSSTRSSRG